jgi:hypothetical protein
MDIGNKMNHFMMGQVELMEFISHAFYLSELRSMGHI